jgi:hypothetical protein
LSAFGRPVLVVVLALLACGPPRVAAIGGPEDDDEAGGEWNEGAEGDPSTSGSTGTTSAASGVEDDDADDPRWDLMGGGGYDLPYGEDLCPTASMDTLLEGETGLGAFVGRRAFFGDSYGEADIVVYDDAADLAHELGYALWYGGEIDSGPAIRWGSSLEFGMLPATWVDAVAHETGDETIPVMASITVHELEFEADDLWLPVRIHGTLEAWPEDATQAIVGPFSAVHCEVFDETAFPE